jgi:uncharacterized membrane protein HdeD (DUF308 family)
MIARLLRWLLFLVAGVMLGAGLFLLGQVMIARHFRAHVQETFFLWRGIGQISFIFQDSTTKAALWLNEIDEKTLRHSLHAAWALIVLGGLMALVVPWMKCGKSKPAPASKR